MQAQGSSPPPPPEFDPSLSNPATPHTNGSLPPVVAPIPSRKRKRAPATAPSPAPSDVGSNTGNGNSTTECVFPYFILE